MNTHGGKREGSGRKSTVKNYSDKFKKGMYAALSAKAKESGKTIQEIIVEMAYSSDKKWGNMKIAAAKLIAEILVTKETHSTVEKHDYAPAIGLPPIKEPENKSMIPTIPPKEFVN